MCAWPPGGMIGPSLCSLWTRVSVFTLRLPDGWWSGWGWIITTEAFFIFPRVTQKNPTQTGYGPQRGIVPDLGESYAAIVQGPSTVNRSAAGLEMGSAMQVSYAAAV